MTNPCPYAACNLDTPVDSETDLNHDERCARIVSLLLTGEVNA